MIVGGMMARMTGGDEEINGMNELRFRIDLVVCKPLLGAVAVVVVAKVVEARTILPALQSPAQNVSEFGLLLVQALDPLSHVICLDELGDPGIKGQQ